MNRVPHPSQPLIPGLPTELSSTIFEHLDAVDFALIRRTNSTWDEYTCATLHRRVYALVSPHVTHYDELAARLVAGGAVIGGSAALHILFPCHPSPPFVELFVPHDGRDELVRFLMDEEGFSDVTRPHRVLSGDAGASLPLGNMQQADDTPGVESDRNIPAVADRRFTEGVRDVSVLASRRFRVYIIESTSSSPLFPLASEWHSALFNYVGPTDFCSAYPPLTSQRRALLNPVALSSWWRLPEELEDILPSWERAGWEVTVEWLPWSGKDTCTGPASYGCAVAQRFFGDHFCASGPVTSLRGRHPADQRAIEDMQTVYWCRGGFTCGEECHSGLDEVGPLARVCAKALFNGL